MKEDLNISGTAAYYSGPDAGVHPGLVLIEEIWGLTDHIKDVSDRYAAEGFNVLAPEILPGELLQILTPELIKDLNDPQKRSEAQPKLRAAMAPVNQPEYAKGAIATLRKCVDYLLADARVNGKVAVLGFCFGGTYSFHLAGNDDRIAAAVPFYGQPPSEEEIERIKCPVLALYGDQDENLMQSLPALKESMQKHGVDFEAVVYPGAMHAFFNDTGYRYNAEAAKDAWKRSLAFLREYTK
jgi:carboxymethylenebutenolidase